MAHRTAWYRARSKTQMTDLATVNRKQTVQDADGNVIQTIVSFTVSCRLEVSQHVPLERSQGGATVAVSIWSCHVPFGTVIQPDDTLSINGGVYEVSDRMDAQTDGVTEVVTLRRVS